MDYSLLTGMGFIFILPFLCTLFCIRNKLKELKLVKKLLLISLFAVLHLICLLICLFLSFKATNLLSIFSIILQHMVTYDFMLFLPFYLFLGCILSILSYSVIYRRMLKLRTDPLAFCPILISLLIALCLYDYFASDHLIINEVCANNKSIEIGEDCYTKDYVELYNDGDFIQNVAGCYLSDDINEPFKKEIPNAQLMKREYLVVEFYDDDFGISKLGDEEIILTGISRKGVEKVKIPQTESDMAYMRQTDGDNTWVIRHGTPGYSNSEAYLKAEAPVFSANSGFYDGEFMLTINAPDNCRIYYTTDGSIPDENSFAYENGILIQNESGTPPKFVNEVRFKKKWWLLDKSMENVDKATIIRAIAIGEKDGVKTVSDVTSATYFVNMDSYKSENVLSIIADPKEMLGEDGVAVTGIEYDKWYYEGCDDNLEPAANFAKRGRKYEIGVYADLLSDSVNLSEDAGFRVSGGSSRDLIRKRFSLYARNQYSDSPLFGTPIFDDTDSHSVKIRQSVAEGIFQKLAENLNIARLKTMPVTVFLNGEYWYRGFLEEKYDKYYFENYYDIPEEELVVINTGNVREGLDSDLSALNEIFDFICSENMKDSYNYDKVCAKMDIESYIDYMCFNIYVENSDISDMKNVMLFKSRNKLNDEYADGRWHWGLYDLDAFEYDDSVEFGAPTMAMKDTFTFKRRCSEIPIGDLPLFASLLRNDEFRDKFRQRFYEIADECFDYSKVLSQFDIDEVYYYDFWGEKKPKEYYLDFFRDRKQNITKYMEQYLQRYE